MEESKKVVSTEIKAFCDRIHIGLNDQQMLAAQAIDGATLLVAVPGSGKTTVLVTRLGYMIIEKGIDPRKILSMTYTKAATIDMKKRFTSLFGEEIGKDVEFRTINGIAEITIRRYAKQYGKYPFRLISDEKQRLAIIKTILINMQDGEFPTDTEVMETATILSYIKNMMMNESDVENSNLVVRGLPLLVSEIYKAYQSTLRNNKLMDFDDQLVYALAILRKYPNILKQFHDEYDYICVDEAQDTSKIQHAIIKLLAQKHGNIFMVGDEDQSIYAFRAAYPKALKEFQTDYPNPLILFMERNYRSTQNIVDTAAKFISKNDDRYDKSFIATRDRGEKIQKVSIRNRDHQYDHIIDQVGKSNIQTAVLYRDNDCAIPLIDRLLRTGVPFYARQIKNSFFTNKAVMDMLAFLKLGIDPYDTESFMRIYHKSNFKCNKQTAVKICNRSVSKQIPIISAIYEIMPSYAARKFCEIMKYARHSYVLLAIEAIMANGYEEYLTQNNLEKNKIDILKSLATNAKDTQDLLSRIEFLDSMVTNNELPQDPNGLILSTIHSSKGLEYDTVYLLDVFNGILPVLPLTAKMKKEDYENYQEERRLFYVAMTRAKNHLYVFDIANKTSEFIEEIRKSLETWKKPVKFKTFRAVPLD